VTRQRLYLDAMEELLPGIKKVILEPGSDTVIVLGGDEQFVPIPQSPADSSP
jgi:hypothetical protein